MTDRTYTTMTKGTRWSGFVRTLLLMMVIMAGAPQAAGQELTPYASNAVNFYFLNADGEYVAYCSNSFFSLPDRMTSPLVDSYSYYSNQTATATVTSASAGDRVYVKYTLTSDATMIGSKQTTNANTIQVIKEYR